MPDREILQRLMPNTYVKYMAQAFDNHAALTAGTPLPAEGLAEYDEEIPVGTVLACLDNALAIAETADWYLDWAKGMAEHYHGPVTMAAVNAPTLGDGLDAFVRYMPARVPYHRWEGRFDGDHFYCELTELLEFGPIRHIVIEIPLLVLHEYVARLHRRIDDRARLDLRYAHTAHAETYATWFQCSVQFDAPHNAFVIPAEWRAIRNPGFDANNWNAALRRCEEMSAPQERPAPELVREAILAYIDIDGDGSLPTLATIANDLHVSPRTLMRRLRAAATKYQIIIDDIRKDRASTLLSDPSLPIYEVGNALGFRDPASFGRSFRRWFNTTPGEYRQRLTANDSKR